MLAARGAIEVGIVVPSILRARLDEAGFTRVEDVAALADYGFASLETLKRIVVTDAEGTIVAMGAAGNYDEALLAAVLGYAREYPLPDSEVPDGIATTPETPQLAPLEN